MTLHPTFLLKTILLSVLLTILFPGLVHAEGNRIQQVTGNPVVVIDPGHGGENFGTIENGYLEKEMTLITAQAMYDYLVLFDNITVYMTRTEDEEVSLKDRVKFAKEHDADFLFSVHYNASLNHELFGSEVWVPLSSPYNNYGFQFGTEFLNIMREEGLFIRGIKTRRNDKGTDYYGILREAVSAEIPAVILEHCHVDEARDEIYCNSKEKLQAMGIRDAVAVAKYFGLSSKALGLDYSSYTLTEVAKNEPVKTSVIDQTPPESCTLEHIETDVYTGKMVFTVSASDSDSPLLYYSYSIDGGNTFTERFPWPESDGLKQTTVNSFSLEFIVPSGTTPKVLVKTFNQYDLFTVSNLYELQLPIVYEKKDTAAESSPEEVQSEATVSDQITVTLPQKETRNDSFYLLLLGAVSLILLGIFAALLLKPRQK